MKLADGKVQIVGFTTLLAVIMAAPKFGDGVDWMVRHWRTTEVAYAGQAKNDEQDTLLDRVTAVLEYQQYTQQQAQQRQAPIDHDPWERERARDVIEWFDDRGGRWCCDASMYDCNLDEVWWRCDGR